MKTWKKNDYRRMLLLVLFLTSTLWRWSGGGLWAQEITVCTGQRFNINAAPSVNAMAVYKWTQDGDTLANAADANYHCSGIDTPGVYSFVRWSAADNGTLQPTPAVWVRVEQRRTEAPVITAPAPGCVGQAYVFTVPDDDEVEYIWSMNGGGSATGNSYVITDSPATTLWVAVYARLKASGCPSPWATATLPLTVCPDVIND